MEVFEGTIRLAGDSIALPAVLLVGDNRLKVSAHHQEIGDWDLRDLTANLEPDGCHVVTEGEELVVSVPRLIQFAEAIGPQVARPGDGSLRKIGGQSKEEPDPSAPGETVAKGWPVRARVALAACLAIVGLAVWAPAVLVGLTLLASLAALLVGGFALMDPYLAVRIPDPATPSLLFRAGVGGVVLAIALAIVL